TEDLGGRMHITADKLMIQMAMPDRVVSNVASRALGNAYYERDNPESLTSMPMDDNFRVYDFTQATFRNRGSGCHPFLLAPLCGQCNIPNPIAQATGNICNTEAAQIQALTFISTGNVITEMAAQAIFQAGSGLTCNQCN